MQKKSIYKYASEAGIPTGLYLSIMSACLLLSVKIPSLPILILPLGLGFPFLLWFLMKRIGTLEPSYYKFSSLWLGGIYTVIFGSLIAMFLSAIYVVTVEPSFVYLYVTNALDTIEATQMSGQYEASIRLMREAIDAHLLPSSLEFLSTMAWFTCFAGSILSLVIALLLSKTRSKITRQFPI